MRNFQRGMAKCFSRVLSMAGLHKFKARYSIANVGVLNFGELADRQKETCGAITEVVAVRTLENHVLTQRERMIAHAFQTVKTN